MSLFDNPDSIILLKNLLQPQDNDNLSSDSEDESQIKSKTFGPRKTDSNSKTDSKAKNQDSTLPKSETEKANDITIDKWLDEQGQEDENALETRKRPNYTIIYKQVVGTEDLFLQVGNKTNASSSCEDMVIDILIPEECVPVHQMDVSVKENQIDFSTPTYRLKLPLMHPIIPDKSTAKYYTEKKLMRVTCRMNREYDFVNF